jgi:hypothetical protein
MCQAFGRWAAMNDIDTLITWLFALVVAVGLFKACQRGAKKKKLVMIFFYDRCYRMY